MSIPGLEAFQRSQQFYQQQNWSQFLAQLQQSVAQDYLPAIKALAGMYLHGGLILKDWQKAEDLFVQASRQGDAAASYQLARIRFRRGAEALAMQNLYDALCQGYQDAWLEFAVICHYDHQALSDLALKQFHHPQPDDASLLNSAHAYLMDWCWPVRQVEHSVLNTSPHVALLKGLLLPFECEFLIDEGKDGQQRAKVVSNQQGSSQQVDNIRTNTFCFLADQRQSLATMYLEAMLCRQLNLPVLTGEPFNVLHYQVQQSYDYHYDFFAASLPNIEDLLKNGGQRVATAVCYLNTVEKGGETRFSHLDISVPAQRGDVVFFRNCDEQGKVDKRSLHAGLPVLTGQKWVATKWFRAQPRAL